MAKILGNIKNDKEILGKTHVEGVEANDLKREFKEGKAINVEIQILKNL